MKKPQPEVAAVSCLFGLVLMRFLVVVNSSKRLVGQRMDGCIKQTIDEQADD